MGIDYACYFCMVATRNELHISAISRNFLSTLIFTCFAIEIIPTLDGFPDIIEIEWSLQSVVIKQHKVFLWDRIVPVYFINYEGADPLL